MVKMLKTDEVRQILASGRFGDLITAVEDHSLECKRSPYRLTEEAERIEMAKDVTGLANGCGGYLLIGPRTERDATHRGDEIRDVSEFHQTMADLDQYRKILDSHTYPPIRGLQLEWHASASDHTKGIISIFVPQEALEGRPYLVHKSVIENDEIVGTLFGYFERLEASVKAASVQELRDRLKDGRRFLELSGHIDSMQQTLSKLVEEKAAKHLAVTPNDLFNRAVSASIAAGLIDRPRFFLAAQPMDPVRFKGIFTSKESPEVKLLENPPRERALGFNLFAGRDSAIVEAKLRRCSGGDRILEMWRDGSLIYTAPGDEDGLCWAMNRGPAGQLRVNNVCLTETAYLFIRLAVEMFTLAEPKPTRILLLFGLLGMDPSNVPWQLTDARPDSHVRPLGWKNAPQRDHNFSIEFRLDGLDAAVEAFNLLAEVYTWFGFNASEVPYADPEPQPPRINPQHFVVAASRG